MAGATEPAQTAHRSFGEQLRALRGAAGLTQEELAERAGLTVHAVSALERGARTRPHPHTVRSLAQALQVSHRDLTMLRAAASSTSPAGAAAALQRTRARCVSPAVRLVGRERELATLAAMLRDPDTRLVTLTGTGGVGKTQLALTVAGAVCESFPGGVTVVWLAEVGESTLVLASIGRALGLPGLTEADAAESIAEYLQSARHLLVLDNFEQVAGAGSDVLALISRCPGIIVLVTSRASLRLRTEIEYPVQPLALPASSWPRPVALSASPAGALFIARARTVAPDFEVTDRNVTAVAGICRRLAGIPLALELAAARLRYLTPEDLLGRLENAMAREGARDLPARQRTMRATIDWSYRLLDPPLPALFRRLAAFSGGFTLEAAEEVCDGAPVGREQVLGGLEGLAEQSLIIASTDQDSTRFGLLEPIAQYARELLIDSGEQPEVHARHVRYFLGLAQRAKPQLQQAQQLDWLARLDIETANTAAAVERALAAGAATAAGRLCCALSRFWWLRGHLLLGRRLADATLEQHIPDPALRVETLVAAATMASGLGDIAAARRQWQQALDVASSEADAVGKINALSGLGAAALTIRDLDGAEQLLTEALSLTTAAGPAAEWTAALASIWLGTVWLLRGDHSTATGHIDHGLAIARRLGDRLAACIALYNLSQVALAAGKHELARGHLLEAIELAHETGDPANLAHLLDALSVIEGTLDRPERVATLHGASHAMREMAGAEVYSYYRPDSALRERELRRARTALGDRNFNRAADHGRQLGLDQAVHYALQDPRVVGQAEADRSNQVDC